jgi:hypothetical protein
MPYKKVKNHPKCSAEKPLGLIKEDDGKLMGCHSSEESANEQIAALHASEGGRKTGQPPEELHMGENIMIYTRALPDTSEVRAEDLLKDPSLPVPFIASTEGVKTDGKNLRAADWDLSAYERYGPILWVHDYIHPPLGTGDARVENELKIDITFDRDDPFAMLIRGKAIKGMMGGSVGWEETKDGRNILREFSMVPMGLDPDALPDIQRTGLRAMQSEILGILDEDSDESLKAYLSTLRLEMMDEIKALLDEIAKADQAEAIEKEIEKEEQEESREAEEEPGERINIPDEDGEEQEEGLAELDLERAGAMLSKKNREDLRKALELIKGVLDRATPDDAVPDFSPMRGEEEETEEIVEPEEVTEIVEQRDQEEDEPELRSDVLTQIMAVLD